MLLQLVQGALNGTNQDFFYEIFESYKYLCQNRDQTIYKNLLLKNGPLAPDATAIPPSAADRANPGFSFKTIITSKHIFNCNLIRNIYSLVLVPAQLLIQSILYSPSSVTDNNMHYYYCTIINNIINIQHKMIKYRYKISVISGCGIGWLLFLL